MLQISRVLFGGLALVTLAASSDTNEKSLSLGCRRKIGQIICSTHYSDHLLDCLEGLGEDSFFRKNTEVCLRPVPEYCATADLCNQNETPNEQPKQPPTVKPKARKSV